MYLSSELTRFRDLLKTRYYLLLQGTKKELLPEVKEFLEKKCNVDYSFETHSLSKTQENKVHYPHKLDERKVQEEVDKQYKKGSVQKCYLNWHLCYSLVKDEFAETKPSFLQKCVFLFSLFYWCFIFGFRFFHPIFGITKNKFVFSKGIECSKFDFIFYF